MYHPPLSSDPGVLLVVQDPLDSSNNIAKTINPQGLKKMQFEVRPAHARHSHACSLLCISSSLGSLIAHWSSSDMTLSTLCSLTAGSLDFCNELSLWEEAKGGSIEINVLIALCPQVSSLCDVEHGEPCGQARYVSFPHLPSSLLLLVPLFPRMHEGAYSHGEHPVELAYRSSGTKSIRRGEVAEKRENGGKGQGRIGRWK
eukprot:125208-Hanusia_phi.AAC.4